ncbi:hypothetical protein BGW41_008404, partial [Actinomortierella wolfii]
MPRVPLCKVKLQYFGHNAARLVDDLLYGFSQTLEDVDLRLKPATDEIQPLGG